MADERRTIRDLYQNADTVMARVAGKREALGTYVEELRDTARAYAARNPEIQRQFERLPAFLDELRPTLKVLGEAADEQAPALANLRASAPLLRDSLTALAGFSTQARPALAALGDAARQGRPAIVDARPNVRQLGRAAQPLPETAQDLAITLEHLDDPAHAVEKDARAGRPGGGFTGLEAVLRYVWAQSQAINLYDANSYMLKVALFGDAKCQNYATPATAKDLPDRCRAWLGPNQPGVTSPDFTKAATTAARKAGGERTARTRRGPPAGGRAPSAPAPGPAAAAPAALSAAGSTAATLLDFLLGP
jgi:hypothetical protein